VIIHRARASACENCCLFCTCCVLSNLHNYNIEGVYFRARFSSSLGRVADAASQWGLEILHGFQQFQTILLIGWVIRFSDKTFENEQLRKPAWCRTSSSVWVRAIAHRRSWLRCYAYNKVGIQREPRNGGSRGLAIDVEWRLRDSAIYLTLKKNIVVAPIAAARFGNAGGYFNCNVQTQLCLHSEL